MSLPIRTTLDDLDAVCNYLVTKPTGATLAEAKAVVDKKRLDGRKLAALKFWGLLEEHEGKLKITNAGRRYVRDAGSSRSDVLRVIVRQVRPYLAVVERAVHGPEASMTATDVAAHWYEHFRSEVSDSEKVLNDQAICFFHIAQGADLGALVIGRRGLPTRFDFDVDTTRAFASAPTTETLDVPSDDETDEIGDAPEVIGEEEEVSQTTDPSVCSNRVFITHGRNRRILDQVKELVTYGKFEPVVAMEHETAAKPVPEKVMSEMRTCRAAVIHVGADQVLYDADGKEVPQINANVLIEIGAAMALYGQNFILLVEEGLSLPSNLQGLYECRYEGDELNMRATMKLLKAFNEF